MTLFRKPDGAGKGDAPRPTDWDKFSNNFDAIFKKKEKHGDEILPVVSKDEGQGRVQTGSDIEQKP
jgi:hypothetical protein